MASTVLVLTIVLALDVLTAVALLVATSMLARRSGQDLKSVSMSLKHGFSFTAEFFEKKDR